MLLLPHWITTATTPSANPQASQTESALAWTRTHTAAVDPFKELLKVPANLILVERGEIPLESMPDVFAGRNPVNPSRARIWDTDRKLHSNG